MMNAPNAVKQIVFGEFWLESESRTFWHDNKEVHLAKRPFDVLLYLIENRERVVSRDELLDKFWDGHDVYDDALRKCVGTIRHSLKDNGKPPHFIETRYGSGFRFIGAVEEKSALINQTSNMLDAALPTNGNGKSSALLISPDFPVETKINKRNSRFVLFAILIASVLFLVSLGFYVYFPHAQKESSISKFIDTPASVRSIAILPLKNLTGDAANDYLSDGITESLINEVSRIETLKVISRSSTFQFKDKDISAQEIGEKLGVETILEGSLQKNGDNVRVQARLVNAKDGSVLWASDSEEKKLTDIFAMQDGIVCQIVTELKVKLCGEVAPSERYTKNVKAYRLYLQGLYYRNQLGAEDLKKAIDFFNQALQIDPNYALAHEGLASTYAVMELNSMVPPGTAAPKAEFHATKALELDDSLAGAYLALGAVKTMQNYDLAERERYYRQALLKNPNHRTAHLWLSNLYTARGEFEQAEREALRAQEIDPLSIGVHLTLADIYYYWRKPDKIIEQANLMLIAKPDDEQAIVYIILADVQKGEFEKAFAELEKIPSNDGMRIIVLAAAGRADEAGKFVEKVVNSDAAKTNPYYIAGIYAVIGDKDAAFAWLEKSYAVRQADLVSIKIDPALDSLHDDSRYQNLLQRVNLAN